jgi:predicted O-methyltransferase YrrM
MDQDEPTNPASIQVRDVIDRIVRDGSVVSRLDASVHDVFPVAISPREGEAIREWVRREDAARTIEIGLGYGVSALYMCQGLIESAKPDSRHVVIDPFQATRFGNCGLQVLDDAGLTPIIEHHAEESQIVLPRLVTEGRSFDLAFVDGDHRFDAVFLDLYYLGRLVRRGGIVILDDYQLPGIQRAASFFLKNIRWELEEVSARDDVHQSAVLRTSKVEDKRPYKFFVEF